MTAAANAWSGESVEWQWRSLEDFGDQPVRAVGACFDLLVIDHPSIGEAIAHDAIAPIDARLSVAELNAVRGDALGSNLAAYTRDGSLWALPIDAASQVAAWYEGSIEPLPGTWEDVVALAGEGKVCLALHPAQAICTFGSLCAMHGGPLGESIDRSVWCSAYADLRALADQGPREQFSWQQPDVLERIATGVYVYTPLVFGFAWYEGSRVRFGRPPAPRGRPSIGTLGGAGVALTPDASDAAARFAAWLAAPEVQSGIVLTSGGQPAGRHAWDVAATRGDDGSFFRSTRNSMETAWTRPTASWWPEFQRVGGARLVASLREGDDAATAVEHLCRLLPSA